MLGPVANRINSELQSEQLRGREVTEAMASPRYLDILTTLQQWRTEVPVTTTPSAKRLRKREKGRT